MSARNKHLLPERLSYRLQYTAAARQSVIQIEADWEILFRQRQAFCIYNASPHF